MKKNILSNIKQISPFIHYDSKASSLFILDEEFLISTNGRRGIIFNEQEFLSYKKFYTFLNLFVTDIILENEVFYNLAPPVIKLIHILKEYSISSSNTYPYFFEDFSRNFYEKCHCNLELYIQKLETLTVFSDNEDLIFKTDSFKIYYSELIKESTCALSA